MYRMLSLGPCRAAFAALGLAACRPEAAPLVAWSETDSAGVKVVEQRISPAKRLELLEQLRLGAADGPDETRFFRLTDGVVLPTGDVLVADAGNHRIETFTRDGQFVRAFGRQGDGPGEFRFAAGLSANDDELVVWDRTRFHFFALDGTLKGTVDFGGLKRGSVGRPVWDGRRWLVYVMSVMGPAGDILEDRPIRVHTLDLERGLSEADLGFDHLWVDDTHRVGRRGWGVRPVLAHDRFYRLDGLARMVVAETGGYDLDIYATSGGLLRRIHNEVERIPVTQADLDAFEHGVRASCAGESGECGEFITDALPGMLALPHPELRPVVGAVETSASGQIMVRRQDLDPDPFADGDPLDFDLLDADGRHLGSFTAPSGFRVLWFDDRKVLGVERTDLDVEQLVLYRFRFADEET